MSQRLTKGHENKSASAWRIIVRYPCSNVKRDFWTYFIRGYNTMEVIFERCGGIDVHKKDVKICIIISGKNRVEKYLEDANVKLSSVATDIFGVSGREILKEILRGNTDVKELSELARGRLKRQKR
jgi:chemotaxis receptor (MCP) glutamine deamidase CheD